MIHKLRRQFIIVATCSILAVLVVIIGALNIINYQVMTNRKDDILELLSNNDGRFPESMNQRKLKKIKRIFRRILHQGILIQVMIFLRSEGFRGWNFQEK